MTPQSTSERVASGAAARDARLLSAALIVLAVLTLLYLAWPTWRAFLPLEIDLNEPWNAHHTNAWREQRALYPDPRGFVINNYPPLSFLLTAALSAVTVDVVYIGRALSLLAVVANGLAIYALIRQLGGSRVAGLVGALFFAATLARFIDKYVGMDDPNLAGLALMMGAFAWMVRSDANGRSPLPAIVAMAVAGFYKHNLLAIPVTAVCWLALRDVRLALRAGVVGAVVAAAGLALCVYVYGETFLQSLMMSRQYALGTALGSLGRLQWIAPALVIFCVWAWHARQTPGARFAMLFIAITFVFHFLQKLGAGVDDNAQFELIAATAVGLGLAFEGILAIPVARRLGVERARLIVVAILIVRLILSFRMAPYLLVASPDFRAELRERAAIVASETARIAAIPGPVTCSVGLVCYWAGKGFLYDPFHVQQRVATGQTTQEDVVQRLRAAGFRVEQVDPRTLMEGR